MFSILIPTFNNLNYLKLLTKSIKENSTYNHQVILHVSDGSDGTHNFVKENNYKYTFSENNIGLCSAIKKISKLIKLNLKTTKKIYKKLLAHNIITH